VEFETAAQEHLFGQVGTLLRAAFDELVLESPEEPAYFVRLGPLGVRVNVEVAGEDAAVVEAYSWLAPDLRVDAEVGLHLARQNVELRFGSLCIDAEDAIILQHALFPEAVSGAVLERLVRALAQTAETLDSELRVQFG
jgi:hypothetical protein